MRNIFSRKSLVLYAILLLPTLLLGQGFGAGNYNYLDFQHKSYYFGISLGYNVSGYNLDHSEHFIRNDTFAITQAKQGPGAHINIITNLKLGRYFDFRFVPGINFGNKTIEYQGLSGANTLSRKQFETVSVEAPFLLRFKSQPYHDMRLFVVGGVRYAYDVANNSKSRQADRLIKVSPHEFSFEAGAGIQLFFPYFIFSPEIRFSYGLGNLLIYNDKLEESSVLDKLLSQGITITINLEG